MQCGCQWPEFSLKGSQMTLQIWEHWQPVFSFAHINKTLRQKIDHIFKLNLVYNLQTLFNHNHKIHINTCAGVQNHPSQASGNGSQNHAYTSNQWPNILSIINIA